MSSKPLLGFFAPTKWTLLPVVLIFVPLQLVSPQTCKWIPEVETNSTLKLTDCELSVRARVNSQIFSGYLSFPHFFFFFSGLMVPPIDRFPNRRIKEGLEMAGRHLELLTGSVPVKFVVLKVLEQIKGGQQWKNARGRRHNHFKLNQGYFTY